MKLASVRLVTNNLDSLVSFYTMLTGAAAARLAEDFAEIRCAPAWSSSHKISRHRQI